MTTKTAQINLIYEDKEAQELPKMLQMVLKPV